MESKYNISKLLQEYLVYIPEIQRDYAQGRDSAGVIREKLLRDIFDVLTGKSSQLTINYIYGVPTNDGKIILIDGQQRTTTLFLIKWYLAVKQGKSTDFLNRLDYATRESSREFCRFLYYYGHCLSAAGEPSAILKNHVKFKKRWLDDPTIISMLNMLDAIDRFYNDNTGVVYENLDKVQFSFVSLDGFKRTEELYAAMNSRGKQLTPFELIKGILLKADASLSRDINGKWTPLFWNLAMKYSTDSSEKESYASNYHDRFLYNYYSFIAQMLWWSKSPSAKNAKKGTILPDITAITEELFSDAQNIEFLRFSMNLVDSDFQSYEFEELTRNEDAYQKGKIVLYDGHSSDEINFFKLCCYGGKAFTQAARCYLWAYVKYKWDSMNPCANASLTDYYSLMRSLFMYRASNETPTSVDKLSLNEELLGKVILPFNSITEGSDEYVSLSQYKLFHSADPSKTEILNNPLVRGCTDNVCDYISETLKKNLNWIWNEIKSNSVSVFKKLAACGFSNLRCEYQGYSDRVFLPIGEKMLKSIFSLRGWMSSADYMKTLEYLRNNDVSAIIDKTYSPADWEYYVEKYDSFRAGAYGQYRVENDSDRMNLNAKFIENERATKNKIRNPFIYEIYLARKQADESLSDFTAEHNVSFRFESNTFKLYYNDSTFQVDGAKDAIDEFLEIVS